MCCRVHGVQPRMSLWVLPQQAYTESCCLPDRLSKLLYVAQHMGQSLLLSYTLHKLSGGKKCYRPPVSQPALLNHIQNLWVGSPRKRIKK